MIHGIVPLNARTLIISSLPIDLGLSKIPSIPRTWPVELYRDCTFFNWIGDSLQGLQVHYLTC